MNSAVAEQLNKVELKSTYDLSVDAIRDLNQALHTPEVVAEVTEWTVKIRQDSTILRWVLKHL